VFRATMRWRTEGSGARDVISDRNRANLMWRLAAVRLPLREKFIIGLSRSADNAQQKTGFWLGSV
jgi:hypothetical protein